jgi:hypothetical protein
MESIINFSFKNKDYTASYVICDKNYPTYIYVSLNDQGLVKEFGEEICIHSDGKNLIEDQIYTGHRLELYAVIFQAIGKVEALKENSKAVQ